MRTFTTLLLASALLTTAASAAQPYTVRQDLNNVGNWEQIKSGIEYYDQKPWDLSETQRQKLAENGFVAIPGDAEQFFQVYESDHYNMEPRIANFITTDCALHMYHVLYDFTLKAVEVEYLYPALRDLTAGMLLGSLEQIETLPDTTMQTAARHNAIYFAVAAHLLRLPVPELPSEIACLVEEELAKIDAHAGRFPCSVNGAGLDYTQFIVRGHYTRAPLTEDYFKAMMWYGLVSFPLDSAAVESPLAFLQPMLISELLFAEHPDREPLFNQWSRVYSITALYVGESLHLTPVRLKEVIPEYFSQELFRPRFWAGSTSRQLERIRYRLQHLPPPRIQTQAVGLTNGVQFRFLSQRYMPDTYVMQRLTKYGVRTWPKGLDVLAVLGSPRADQILTEVYDERMNWSAYGPRLDSLKAEFAGYDSEWSESLVAGWLYMLQALHQERTDYPSFMQNDAWRDKQLTTTQASWAEMRRDAILYANPSSAEGDMGVDTHDVRGYVEPVLEFWKRLHAQVQRHKQILMAAGYMSGSMSDIFARYEEIVEFCKNASEKELAGNELDKQEYGWIRTFGGRIELWTLDVLSLDRHIPVYDRNYDGKTSDSTQTMKDIWLKSWYQVTGPDRDLACVADVHNSDGLCLEVATGHLDEIFVVVPIADHLRMVRGAILSYYEFTYAADHRLNDEAWQEMIKRGSAPKRPEWVKSYLVP